MAHPRKFRFGVQAGHGSALGGDGWTELARRAEALGYSTLLIPDHFGDQLAPVPALMAAAAATTTLRVGALVFGNDYRHPVVLAKEAATIDVLSGGRTEFALGAGWMTSDYQQGGVELDPPGVRIDRLIEALAICRGLWSDGPLTHHGKHYTITELEGHPKPAQRPHPPILLGGGGRRMLQFAAREADIVGINPSLRAGDVTPETIAEVVTERVDAKIEWVREAAGDRFADLELNLLVQMAMVVENRAELIEAMAPGFGLTPTQAGETPYAWIGTIDEIVDDVVAHRERWGISYWVVHEDAMEAMAPVVERLIGT